MSVLSQALKGEQWEMAALCLLLGLARALSQLPADSVVGLMEVVEGKGDGQGGSREVGPGFYEAALTRAERVRLPQARRLEGLDEEIAVLRVRLASALAQKPEDLPLLMKGVELLVKAVSAKYRLSKKAEDDLYQSVLGVLRGIGGVLWPEGQDGV